MRPAETPAAATACLAKLRELMEITKARSPKQTIAMIASAPRSPIAARAGSQTRLSRSGDGGDELGRVDHREAGHVAVAEDRDGLDADDETGADDARDDLRDQPGALGAEEVEEAEGHQDRERGRECAERGEDAVGGEASAGRR